MANELAGYLDSLIERTKTREISWKKRSPTLYVALFTNKENLKKARLVMQETVDLNSPRERDYILRVTDMDTRTDVITVDSSEKAQYHQVLQNLFNVIGKSIDAEAVDYLKELFG